MYSMRIACGCPRASKCPLPKVFSTHSCSCECPHINSYCTYPKVFSRDTYMCEFPIAMEVNCPSNQEYNAVIGKCVCLKSIHCSPPLTLNTDICQCECLAASTYCPSKFFDKITCSCKMNTCSIVSCPSQKVLSNETCKCTYPSGQKYLCSDVEEFDENT